ncbi:MAG TPA: 23S rRNA (pseudouridine(1915)-N(3))-methyltransferase RlmH [Sedimentibacter sp.]|jgi:23S rRNA (pseudouridine1915-N3)-methyltransferase|nr:23S rRNA (pseudouridine(1915)-N(3))-methyltransferase RlmH [Sedimentibacter sp.]NLA13074.1 23S rRNA (pseudouridine(1915)-N(3))-methyltransferase RlmH [Tissierellia bacterium]HAS90990.1 23S rRNA (pseudouridine(1915)-N(3))-methyltransferase RlmH [Clostridiales bacterium]HOA19215.1 23S rRNA (pseudouridine(1915)-N(3))-methyltransferase RlmH [Sedimentibacter sp.]HOG62285.1 23S rRNA (pseudouridine(1915)-N(3))-methyltransferase RlmH [Sedimentibacter sp.]
MKITIISVGKIKEKFFTEAIKEYIKRLSKYCKFIEEIVPDERADESFSPAEIEQVKIKEGQKILNKIPKNSYVIVLDINGAQLSSEAFAEKLNTFGIEGISDITFIIGGSNGLWKEVIKSADFNLSFSKMTFPHQLFKVILLEQIYRAFKINSGETYHK